MVPNFLLHGEFGSTFFFFLLDNLAKEEDELHKNGYFLAGVFPWSVY
jgi:hypothetical protein